MPIRAIAFAVAFLLLAGPAGAQRPVRSLLEMRQENLIMQQWDLSCGAAALATLLTYHRNYPVTEKQVAQGMLQHTEPLRVKYRGGFSLLDMQRYASTIGFAGDGYSDMTLEDLAARAPMIVPIQARGYDHFVLVRSANAHSVDIGDPGFGNYRMQRTDFLRTWPGIGFEIKRSTGDQ
jgi:predicted double-glycine peptidase